MQNIDSFVELRYTLQILEIERSEKALLLKEQFYITYESLKPVNLIRSSLKELFLSPNLMNNLVGTTVGVASGYLSKKIVSGSSEDLFCVMV